MVYLYARKVTKYFFKNEIQLLASLGNHLEMLKVLKYVSSVCLKRANLYLFAN